MCEWQARSTNIAELNPSQSNLISWVKQSRNSYIAESSSYASKSVLDKAVERDLALICTESSGTSVGRRRRPSIISPRYQGIYWHEALVQPSTGYFTKKKMRVFLACPIGETDSMRHFIRD
jgi:hypothetical protein